MGTTFAKNEKISVGDNDLPMRLTFYLHKKEQGLFNLAPVSIQFGGLALSKYDTNIKRQA